MSEEQGDEQPKPVHVIPVELEDPDLEPHFPSSKSMENMESIILENPIESEEETDTSLSHDPLDSIAEEANGGTELSPDDAEKPLPFDTPEQPAPQQTSTAATEQEAANVLSQYFSAPESSVAPGGEGDFFDTLSGGAAGEGGDGKVEVGGGGMCGEESGLQDLVETAKEVTEVKESGDLVVEAETEQKTVESDSEPSQITKDSSTEEIQSKPEETSSNQIGVVRNTERIRTTSVSEEIPVAFEESKGDGLKFAPSTKSLCKFFTDNGANPVSDQEGQSFFDTFTAAENEDEPGDQAPASLTMSEGRNSVSDTTSIPPETPPVIPGTSPFHSQPPTPLPTNQQPAFSKSISQEGPGSLAVQPETEGIQVTFQSGDDPFSKSLNLDDDNRRYDAWIPSELTRQVLVAMATSAPGMYVPNPENLTMPGIIVDEPQGDPVRELVKKYCGEQEASCRKTLALSDVPQNEEGLRYLIDAECYRAAIDLTGILLNQCGQGIKTLNQPSKHTSYSLQLWLVRISLLMKLRMYNQAESECHAFGNLDKPDLYYEYYADLYPGRKGCMVPFNLRVLHAELPLYLGKTQESLDRLYYLHAIVLKILTNLESGLSEDGSMMQLTDKSRKVSRQLWESREIQLLYSIGNCLLNIKDYNTALSIYENLLKKDARNEAALVCGMGRIYLQMGDIRQAEQCFKKAENLTKMSTDNLVKSRNLLNRGFLALGQNQFKDAQQYFKDAVTADPGNAVAINNMAVSALYTGKLKEALNILEQLIHSDPSQYLQEGILFNLCTLYELESSHALFKKQKLLELVSRHKGNGFNVACLKMP